MSAPNKLFVYGIFLGESMRKHYNMTNPQYAVVPNYATYVKYGNIVEAYKVAPECDAALTGLVVDADPDKWEQLDFLEGGYERILVTTTNGQHVFMYAAGKDKYEIVGQA